MEYTKADFERLRSLDADDHCPIVIIGEDEAMNVDKLKCS
jgi:hypothetical protein